MEKLTVGVITSYPKQAHDLMAALRYTDTRLIRYVTFVYLRDVEDVRGRKLDGYVMGYVNTDCERCDQIKKECQLRNVKQWVYEYTNRGPVFTLNYYDSTIV